MKDNREKAEQYGYSVIDSPTIIATHLTEMIKQHAADILDRQAVKGILDELQKTYSAVVEEVNKIGLKFGIWFEPEMISIESELYKKLGVLTNKRND